MSVPWSCAVFWFQISHFCLAETCIQIPQQMCGAVVIDSLVIKGSSKSAYVETC